MPEAAALLTGAAALLALLALLAVLRLGNQGERQRLLAEQAAAGLRSLDETMRRTQVDLANAHTGLVRDQGELKLLVQERLGEIQRSVNEQLHAAVEKQMGESFARVIEQFAAVQKAMGDVQATAAQIGDIRRLFSNVRTRGGWGETQARAMLDDILPPGSYETNVRIRPDSAEAVEFAVRMPSRDQPAPLLPIDAKFPVEDYERLLAASEAGDAEAERLARAGLERRIRGEAKKIAEKYIHPPVTVNFAVLYVPTDALYVEIARIPGLIDALGREGRVIVLGPSLFPALLRTIHLGCITLTLEKRADEVRMLLGATRAEMLKMDGVLERLGKQASTMTGTIEDARRRTRAVDRKLRSVEATDAAEAERLLELDRAADETL